MLRRFERLSQALTLLVTLGAAQARADWSMYNHDAAGSRHDDDETVLNPRSARRLRVLWETPAKGVVTGTPLQHDGVVYVGDHAGWFHALEAATGDEIWSVATPTGAPITATAAIV